MHKKAFTTTIALIIMIILVSAGVFLVVTKTHKNVTPVEQEVVNSDTQNVSETSDETGVAENTIDTSNWQTYKNDEYGFEVKYPEDFVYTFQSAFNSEDGAEYLFYSAVYDDVAKSDNPLLAVIDKNDIYISLSVMLLQWDKSVFENGNYNLQDQVMQGLSDVSGEIVTRQKLITWENLNTNDSKSDMFFYEVDHINIKNEKNISRTTGVIWLSDRKLFSLTLNNANSASDKELCKNMAMSFLKI